MNAGVRRVVPYLVTAALIVGFFGIILLPSPAPTVIGMTVALLVAADVRGIARSIGANIRTGGSARRLLSTVAMQRRCGRAVGVAVGALTLGLTLIAPRGGDHIGVTGSRMSQTSAAWGFPLGAALGVALTGAAWIMTSRRAARTVPGSPELPPGRTVLEVPITSATEARVAAAIDALEVGVTLDFEVVGVSPADPGLVSTIWAYRNPDGTLQVAVDRLSSAVLPRMRADLGANDGTSFEDMYLNSAAGYGGASIAAAIMSLQPRHITATPSLSNAATSSFETVIAATAMALGIRPPGAE